MLEYIILNDNGLHDEQQSRYVITAHEAVSIVFAQLKARGNEIRLQDEILYCVTWDSEWIKDRPLTKTISTHSAATRLEKEKSITIWLESNQRGLIASRTIKKDNLDKSAEEHQNKLLEMGKQIKKLMTDNTSPESWKPTEANPVSILQDAENRLFSYQLQEALKKAQMSSEALDQALGFVEGTCDQMLNNINPLRPTKIVIDQIARSLHVKPENLWVDLVTSYLNKTRSWEHYL